MVRDTDPITPGSLNVHTILASSEKVFPGSLSINPSLVTEMSVVFTITFPPVLYVTLSVSVTKTTVNVASR